MLLQVNTDEFDLNHEIKKNCGNPISLLNRILYSNFGSSKYKLEKILQSNLAHQNFNFQESIYTNFDLREMGLVFYFRIKNIEFVEFCSYFSVSFQSNDDNFTLQTSTSTYQFKILNKRNHINFLKKLYQKKNNNT